MTRRRMVTVFYDPDAGEVLECQFSDAWLTGGSLLRLDTLIDLSVAIREAREEQRKGQRDVH